jgi:hypothetical protein
LAGNLIKRKGNNSSTQLQRQESDKKILGYQKGLGQREGKKEKLALKADITQAARKYLSAADSVLHSH